MRDDRPSRTALRTAGLRAAHQELEGGAVFTDPLALRILGPDGEVMLAKARANPEERRGLRLFMAGRARFAEDALGTAVGRGATQLVVLGAGLDTFAYRNPHPALRVFEVDHPATQGWKRGLLARAGIAEPPTLRFAPVDFERQTLAQGLAAAGFDASRQTFFTWLGVVPYLSETAITATLAFVAALPGGAHVVFDYANPPHAIANAKSRAALEALAARVARAGESIVSYFETPALTTRLRSLGFRDIEDIGSSQIAARYCAGLPAPSGGGAHLMRAATLSPPAGEENGERRDQP
jgi:methyltransferase (TIGR00027 family)